jgi:CheY-like chemotaxis protein
VVDKVAWMLKRIVGENITVHLHYSATPAGVLADSTMIEQVLLNLVVNARDAMPEGGMVEIETHLCTVTEEAAKAVEDAKPGEYVCLSIRDTGSGMSPAVQARLFEPFFTTKDVGKGTGMGLSVVHGIVRQHQGWIEVETAPNRGSLFRIYMPYVALPAGQPADTPVVSTPIPVGSETILLVEDEPPLRNIMRTFLQDLGYQVIEAASGRSALTIWREQSANIQLLLTDMVMPGRLNGRELAERVHHDRPDLPVLYITGYSPETASGAISLKEGVNYIPKPFTPRRLGMAVRAVLDARSHPNVAVTV